MKIESKLTLFHFLITGTIILIFGFLYYYQVKTSIDKSINQKLTFVLENVIEAFELDNTTNKIEFQINEELANEELANDLWITIIAPNREILYQSTVAKIFPLPINNIPLDNNFFSYIYNNVHKNHYFQADDNNELAFRFKSIKLDINNKLDCIIIAGVPTESYDITLEKLENSLLIGLAGFLFILSIAGYFFVRYALKPIKTAVKIQKQFVSDVSHELKTPLTILRLSIESIVGSEKLTKQGEEKIASSLDVLHSVNFLIKKLLLLSKLEEQGKPLLLKSTSLSQIIEKCYHNLLLFAEAKALKLTLNSPAQEIWIRADKELCYTALFNVIENAIKYTLTGTVIITVKEQGAQVEITINDTGIGMNKEDTKKMFERFYRADRSRTTESSYGIGLSITKKIIELHKGSITINSKKDQGTLVTIRLPLA